MDRRQRKTREAIFKAFIGLLSEESFDRITVSEIIHRADIGRATFYAHFETKDFLLRELCGELFDHMFESAVNSDQAHNHIFDCDAPDSVFLHLFGHLRKNDNNILDLLSCRNNELFLRYFKKNLTALIQSQLSLFRERKAEELPEDFWIDHIASTFTATVQWWVDHDLTESTETITKYFLAAV